MEWLRGHGHAGGHHTRHAFLSVQPDLLDGFESLLQQRCCQSCFDSRSREYDTLNLRRYLSSEVALVLFPSFEKLQRSKIERDVLTIHIISGGDAVTGGSIGNANSTGAANGTDRCDLCFIKNLQFQAGSPYYDGPLLAEHSVYQSKTSSCGISGYPLTTSDLSFYT